MCHQHWPAQPSPAPSQPGPLSGPRCSLPDGLEAALLTGYLRPCLVKSSATSSRPVGLDVPSSLAHRPPNPVQAPCPLCQLSSWPQPARLLQALPPRPSARHAHLRPDGPAGPGPGCRLRIHGPALRPISPPLWARFAPHGLSFPPESALCSWPLSPCMHCALGLRNFPRFPPLACSPAALRILSRFPALRSSPVFPHIPAHHTCHTSDSRLLVSSTPVSVSPAQCG